MTEGTGELEFITIVAKFYDLSVPLGEIDFRIELGYLSGNLPMIGLA